MLIKIAQINIYTLYIIVTAKGRNCKPFYIMIICKLVV